MVVEVAQTFERGSPNDGDDNTQAPDGPSKYRGQKFKKTNH
jgi:hypothetical protein